MQRPEAVQRPEAAGGSAADWIAVSAPELPISDAMAWATMAGCGGVVTFCGTVRDHSDGRPGVTGLEYEAYLEQVVPRLEGVAQAARSNWPTIVKGPNTRCRWLRGARMGPGLHVHGRERSGWMSSRFGADVWRR